MWCQSYLYEANSVLTLCYLPVYFRFFLSIFFLSIMLLCCYHFRFFFFDCLNLSYFTYSFIHSLIPSLFHVIIILLFMYSRFRSVNCTIGPGSSEWYAVEKEHSGKLRQIVLDNHQVDIFGKEGSWFLSPQFLIKHKIPFLHG